MVKRQLKDSQAIAPWQRKVRSVNIAVTIGLAYYLVFWADFTSTSLSVPKKNIFSPVSF
jgi:tRNA(Leu) C34 or U34 (ribose-2'-O)-methylase TrmL